MKQQFTDVQVPLNKLAIHPCNVRATHQHGYSEDEIKPLAANIQAYGLLQPLIVQKLEDGSYGVVGGGRRRAALLMLSGDKTTKGFTKSMKVACRELPPEEDQIASVSFSENELQLPMDMLDRFEAFTAMLDKDGCDVGEIARAFSISDRKVKEALRLGKIHPEIRAAYRAGQLDLEALKAFEAHPDPAVQLESFTAILEEYGHVVEWRVRSAFRNRFVRIGDQLGQFVLEEYREAGGDIIADLIEEDSILSDETLINKVLEQKLGDLADQKRAELGFAWAEARADVDWDTFQDFGRVYPQSIDLDEETQAKADKIVAEMDAIEAQWEATDDADEQCRLDEQNDALSDEHRALTTGYSAADCAIAGVIAVWQNGDLRFNIGFVRPEDMPVPPKSDADSSSAARADTVAAPTGPKISAKLRDDMAHVRTRAVGLALAQSSELARDYAEFTLIQKVIGRAGSLVRNTSTLSASKASYGPQEPEGSLAQIEAVFETLYDGLDTDWMAMEAAESFAAFRALSAEARGALLAFAVAATLEPHTAQDLRDPVRETVEREALPNIRDVWAPDEAFLNRLTKSDLLQILSEVGLNSEASVYADGKKSKLVDYTSKLFAEPFATLTDTQREAVISWAPDLMAHAPIEDIICEADETDESADDTAIAAE